MSIKNGSGPDPLSAIFGSSTSVKDLKSTKNLTENTYEPNEASIPIPDARHPPNHFHYSSFKKKDSSRD
jgi:hypothetical protein